MHPSLKEYEDSLQAEMRIYRDCTDVHLLPPIFHYWSNRHIRPALSGYGASGSTELFAGELVRQCDGKSSTGPARFVSLGAGNCDLELDLARRLSGRRRQEFIFECVDLNPDMLERGRRAAAHAGLADRFAFHCADLNFWQPAGECRAVIANQSLHHVIELESLFGEVRRCLAPGGVFLVSDMIGRNGHMRWPEALSVVHEFWRKLPPSYRINQKSGCYEELFFDHDCSGEGFEGVRSQDILPLLADRFHFRFFFPFGNAIDPFIDRSFGPNFDEKKAWDRAFIDAVHERDCRELASGRLKPTHMIGVMGAVPNGTCIFPGNMSPGNCVRGAHGHPVAVTPATSPYQWDEREHDAAIEVHRLCDALVHSVSTIRERTDWALGLERDFRSRSQQCLALEGELSARTSWAIGLDSELRKKSDWALSLREELSTATTRVEALEAELAERTRWAQSIDTEVALKTAWALSLQAELEIQVRRAEAAEKENARFVRNPLRLAARIVSAAVRRLGFR